MGYSGYIKAVKLDRKETLLLAKHLLHIKKKKKLSPQQCHWQNIRLEKNYVSFKEDTLKKERKLLIYILDVIFLKSVLEMQGNYKLMIPLEIKKKHIFLWQTQCM